MLPVASECFAQDRVVRFLEALRLLVESGKVPLHDRLHPVERLVLSDGTERCRFQILFMRTLLLMGSVKMIHLGPIPS